MLLLQNVNKTVKVLQGKYKINIQNDLLCIFKAFILV
jgi:hypothetical protein